jgi:hypothetical protein
MAQLSRSRSSVIMGWTTADLGFDPRYEQRFSLQYSVQTVLGSIENPFLGVKWPRSEADHSNSSSQDGHKCVELYLLSSIRFHSRDSRRTQYARYRGLTCQIPTLYRRGKRRSLTSVQPASRGFTPRQGATVERLAFLLLIPELLDVTQPTFRSYIERCLRCSSETSADFQRTARSYFSGDRTLHNHYCENLTWFS